MKCYSLMKNVNNLNKVKKLGFIFGSNNSNNLFNQNIKIKNFSTNTIDEHHNLDLKDLLPDHFTYKIPTYKKNTNLDFPWIIEGAPILEIKSRFLPDQVFARNRVVSRRGVLEHFFKMYRGVLLASSQYDYDFLEEYCETQFFNKLKEKLKTFQNLNYKIDVLEDMKANRNQRINPEMHLYDCIVFKGISTDRTKNGRESDYFACNDVEEMGFISYINKSMTDPGNFVTRDLGESHIKNSDFKTIVFRAYCMFKCGLKLFINDENGNQLINYSSNYNFNHVAVFECEMQDLLPLKSYGKVETYTEWISKHDFGIWKMIDMDNWMKGNDYFLKE